MQKIKVFINDVQGELKKVAWPTKEELKDATIVVIIGAIILAVFIGCVDFILKMIMTLLIR
jgi:preprotein translocase subunit SecE